MVEGSIKLNWAEFIDMDLLSRDSAFNVELRGIIRGSKSFFG